MSTPLPSIDLQSTHAQAVRSGVTILEFFDSLPWLMGAADWTAWRAFLAAAFGLQMTPRELGLFQKYTGRQRPPKKQVNELWSICGRRSRKSAIAAVIGVYLSSYRDYRKHLAPGERARALILSKDKDDAGQIHNFASAILHQNLPHLLEDEPTQEDILLKNQTEMKIRAFSLTAGRTRAIIVGLLDEVAFFPTEDSATPDIDVIRGIRPALANIPGSMLCGFSSPFGKQGILFDRYEQYYGVDSDDVLVWKAPTLAMHDTPAIRLFVAKEYETDATSAEAEVGAEFRAVSKDFVSLEVIRECTDKGVLERKPDVVLANRACHTYHGFVDVSGGSSDSFAVAVAHWDFESDAAVLDALREWKPDAKVGRFSPKAAVKDVCDQLKRYRIGFVVGDHYAGEWPRERFRENDIGYHVSERDKSQIYRDSLPLLNTPQCRLLDNAELAAQLKSLVRKITPRGQEVITHRKGAHDDVANAACGALVLAYDWGKNAPRRSGPERYKDTNEYFEREIIGPAERELEEEQDSLRDGGSGWRE